MIFFSPVPYDKDSQMLYRISMLLFIASCLIAGCGEKAKESSQGSIAPKGEEVKSKEPEGKPVKEIKKPSDISKRLIALGFTEDPKEKGRYTGEIKLGKLMEQFGLANEDLEAFPNPESINDWTVGTDLEGNPATIRRRLQEHEQLGPETSVSVWVNLDAFRLEHLVVGYGGPGEKWLRTAFNLIGAEMVDVDPDKVLPPDLKEKSAAVYCVILPDKTGLVLTYARSNDPPNVVTTPSPPRINGMFIGPAGKGFENWKFSDAKSVDRLPPANQERRRPSP
jgi:hypothetical protein